MDKNQYKKTVEHAFDEASEGYDGSAMRFFDNSAGELARGLVLSGAERVLDAATGTGKVAVAVGRRLTKGEVLGIDLSEGMLARAVRRAKDAGLASAAFRRMDVDAADFPPESFDGFTCGFGVHFWQDMEGSLSRLLGAVKKGGFVAVTSFAKGSFEPHAGICLGMFARYGVKLPDSYSTERLDHPDKVKKVLSSVGLKEVSSRRFQAGYDLGDPGDWWDLIRFTGFRAFLDQLTPDQAARYREEFLQAVGDARKNGKVSLNVDVIITTAVK